MVDRNRDLSERVARLGFPLLQVDPKSEANETLAEVVRSKEARLWEGFPVMLANAVDTNLFDYEQLRNTYLRSDEEIATLGCLISLSLALYRAWDLNKPHFEHLRRYLRKEENPEPEDLFEKLKNDRDLNICGRWVSSERLMTAFRNYYIHGRPNIIHRENQRGLSELLSTKRLYDLEYSLSQIFSAKQKELVLKKFKGEKFTKTEKEYFSRTVRKKLLALANQELHQLAMKLL